VHAANTTLMLVSMQDGTQKSQKVFVNIPTEVGATEAEEIGTALLPVSAIPCSQHSQHAPVTWLLFNPPSMAEAIYQQVSEALFTHPAHVVTNAPV